MKLKFITLEDVDKNNHSFLEKKDEILYLGEYHSGLGCEGAGCNSLIFNLKKTPDKINTVEWDYKQAAITTIAALITKLMEKNGTEVAKIYWIPVPPSKIEEDPMFDDRVHEILKLAQEKCTNKNNIVANVVKQTSNRAASATSRQTRNPNSLIANYEMDDITDYNPETDIIIIFDDVLTTGCHFKAVKSLILGKYEDSNIIGIFVAKVVRQEEPTSAI